MFDPHASPYPRDMRGYGRETPDPRWPGGAALCVQFALNYEEGGENNILHGDPHSEAFLADIPGATNWPGQRHWNMESMYEYGARAGFWRLWRLFTGARVPLTIYGVATALDRGREQAAAMREGGWEIASHGLKWIDYKSVPKETEREHLHRAIALHAEVTGERPLGFYIGRCSMNTRDLVMEEGGFAYSSDSYADDLPYWVPGPRGPHLVIPYALDTNDMRFAAQGDFSSGDQFHAYLKDAFDVLYAEGKAGRPKLLNIGLHCRLAGRPGRFRALERFLEHVRAHDDVWVPRRLDIARHWREHHKPASP